ncbi:hypothetical protein VSS74_09855 [Conexibacter stalactiti]|uniref:Uncharacterized protein n=1 Tax=Conexibacter stalactiti TaxID=1940611 RepID=A0ABU4HMV1_9ACTN|nr:hypothetical protein [Conexibacter stalactiti]MDW5594641.1 hypothetical protein [Conexibacter stalactiti]MEC5035283.1 hypothetical protein [Conexibacter stalactiti]
MHGWIDYYEPAQATVTGGQIWFGEPIALPAVHGLRIDRVSPRDDTRASVTFADRAAAAAGDHPPIKVLGLRSDESAAVVTARRRPLVVLGGAGATELTPAGPRAADTVLVVPVESVADHPRELRLRIAAYEFPNAFYLPAAPQHRFAEGFARLDQAQPLPRAALTGHRGFALTADALDALVEWFVAYSTGRRFEDSLIADYRRERLAELDAG